MDCSTFKDHTSLVRLSNVAADRWIAMYSSVSTRISHPWSAASSRQWLTPRGGPRQKAVVGVVPPRRLQRYGCTAAPESSRFLVATSVARPATCGDSEGHTSGV